MKFSKDLRGKNDIHLVEDEVVPVVRLAADGDVGVAGLERARVGGVGHRRGGAREGRKESARGGRAVAPFRPRVGSSGWS